MNGRIRDDDVQEVRRRASIADVAAEYMQVKRAGRQFRALCPFHTEKTPSFYMDPTKGVYNCHGCHEGGDVITLVRKLENLTFVEAIERLAARTGVQLRYEQLSKADQAAAKRRLRLVDAHRHAIELYHNLLMGPEGTHARDYLKSRGFTKETVQQFRVGLSSASKRDELCRHLAKLGFAEAEILEAGLGVKSEGSAIVDRFRGRVMFPIFELTGDPVAFGARKLGDGDGPKYLNSAESPIYKKSTVLYALNFAKGEVVKNSRALLVEGYTDVIALHQAGIKEAVATCGTALGLEHMRTIQRFTQNVVLSLDADEAGGTAADRTYEQLNDEAQKMGVTLRVVRMPAGDDPADSVGKLGPDGFRELIRGAEPLIGFVLQREAARYRKGDPDEQSRALASGVRLLARTERQELVDEYVRRLASWISVDANIIYYELDRLRRTGAAPKVIGESVIKRSSAQVRREKEALKLAIQFPTLVKEHVEELEPGVFSIPAHRTLWLALAAGDDPTTLSDDAARRSYTELAVQPPIGDVTERLIEEIFGRLKESALVRQIEELKLRLQRVNPLEQPEHHETLFAELIELERQKRRLSVGEEDTER